MIDFAAIKDIDALKQIWSVCFGDPAEYIDLFFSRRFKPEEALLYRDSGRPVAVVYMLPLGIMAKGALRPSHYIYAAATLPEFRGRGVMREILNQVEIAARQKGQVYSVLVPGEQSLFAYYEKMGYRTAFYMKHLTLGISEVSVGRVLPKITVTGDMMARAAARCLERHEYAAFWDISAMDYIIRETAMQGGEVLGFSCGGEPGYAILVPHGDRMAVKEIMCEDAELQNALATVARYFPVTYYELRLRSDTSYRQGETHIDGFAMLKPLVADFSSPENNAHPYINLVLD